MNLVKFKKDSELLNDTFKSILNSPRLGNLENFYGPSNYIPKVRISEDRDNFYVKLEIPGITKDDVKVSIENNVLTVNGVKKQERKSEETNLITNEIYYGEFSRSFNITNDIKVDSIDAEYKDGILNITLPKIEEAKPVVKEVNIK